jgi:hypothetical protein
MGKQLPKHSKLFREVRGVLFHCGFGGPSRLKLNCGSDVVVRLLNIALHFTTMLREAAVKQFAPVPVVCNELSLRATMLSSQSPPVIPVRDDHHRAVRIVAELFNPAFPP